MSILSTLLQMLRRPWDAVCVILSTLLHRRFWGCAILMFGPLSSQAQVLDFQIIALVHATNTPAGLPTNIVINIGTADTRYFTNNAASAPATSIQTTNSTAATISNLVAHLNAHEVYSVGSSGPRLAVGYNETNTSVAELIAPMNTNITVAFGGGWAFVTYVTNRYGPGVPILSRTNSMSLPTRTNAENAIVNLLAQNRATNALPTNSAFLQNYIDKSTAQTMYGKTLIVPIITGGQIVLVTNFTGTNVSLTNVVISYVALTNVSELHGVLGNVSSGIWTNGTLLRPLISGATFAGTNVFSGSSIELVGSGVNSFVSLTATTTVAAVGPYLFFNREDGIGGAPDSGDVLGGFAWRGYGTTGYQVGARFRAIPIETFTDTTAGTALLFETTPSGAVQPVGRLHIGSDGNATITNSLTVGGTNFAAFMVATNFVGRGGSLYNMVATTLLGTNVTLVDTTFAGTNTWTGDLALVSRPNANPINGDNAGVNLGTNVVIHISGPTTIGAYCGFAASRADDFKLVRFSGAVTNILRNQSGTEPTAANRIITGTGADLSLTNEPSWAWLKYNGTVLRWEVLDSSK